MTHKPRVALVTCKELPDLTADDQPLLKALADRGVQAEPVVWDNPDVEWGQYALVVVRSTWDYAQARPAFLEWARKVPHLANAANVVEWNTDKRYLADLAEADVPVIPTVWLDPERHFSKRAVHTRMPAYGDFVVKPVISSRAKDTGRYQPIDVKSRMTAIKHVMRLLDTGRPVMIQPYITSVDLEGETSLVFIDGQYSHAARKEALLGGQPNPTVGLSLYPKRDQMSAVKASADCLEAAERALAAAASRLGCATKDFLYARVDLLRGETGPLVIELELVEPALWMAYDGGAGTLDKFADAIAARANQPAGTH